MDVLGTPPKQRVPCTLSSTSLVSGQGFTRKLMIFGLSEEQIADFFLTYGVGAFILLMLSIIGQLAWQSKAGKFGTMIMFIGLGLGILGFVAKIVLQSILER